MKTKLENRWREFCKASNASALSTLEKTNSKYKNIVQRHSTLNNHIMNILNAESASLSAKTIAYIKEYLILTDEKQEFEKNAVYSQGICDCFSIVEKFR